MQLPSHHTTSLSSYHFPLILPLSSHNTTSLSSYHLPLIIPLTSHHTTSLSWHHFPLITHKQSFHFSVIATILFYSILFSYSFQISTQLNSTQLNSTHLSFSSLLFFSRSLFSLTYSPLLSSHTSLNSPPILFSLLILASPYLSIDASVSIAIVAFTCSDVITFVRTFHATQSPKEITNKHGRVKI